MDNLNLSFQERLAESRRMVMKAINTKRPAARTGNGNKQVTERKPDKIDGPSPYRQQLEANRAQREKQKELARQEREKIAEAKATERANARKAAAAKLEHQRAKEKRVAKENQRVFKDLQTKRDKESGRDKPFKTIPFTTEGKIEVRIDANTVIYVKEGTDIQAAIDRIKNRPSANEKIVFNEYQNSKNRSGKHSELVVYRMPGK